MNYKQIKQQIVQEAEAYADNRFVWAIAEGFNRQEATKQARGAYQKKWDECMTQLHLTATNEDEESEEEA